MLKKTYLLLAGVLFLIGCSHKKTPQKKIPTAGPPKVVNHAHRTTFAIDAKKSNFFAALSGDNIVPSPIKTSAEGTVYIEFSKDSSQLYYTLKLRQATAITAAKLAYGASGNKGAVICWLYPAPDKRKPILIKGPVNGILKSSMINQENLTGPFRNKKIKDVIRAIQRDSIYVKVNTQLHPEGEIRGQLQKKP